MAKYDFYISYSRHDGSNIAQALLYLLEERGYSVFIDVRLAPGENWKKALPQAMADSEYIVPIITDAYLLSESVQWELEQALIISKHCEKKFIPFFCTNASLPDHISWLTAYHGAVIRHISDIRAAVDNIDDRTGNNSGDYDVFISFKSEDSDMAEKIYRLCQRHMKIPFWSKKTLSELSEAEYEKAIYAALDKSTHFVVVLSKLEYMNAPWVSNEMSTFHREKIEGRKSENANFVFVVTDDLYKNIISNNKMNLPIQYRGYHIIKMSEYADSLMQYFN